MQMNLCTMIIDLLPLILGFNIHPKPIIHQHAEMHPFDAALGSWLGTFGDYIDGLR